VGKGVYPFGKPKTPFEGKKTFFTLVWGVYPPTPKGCFAPKTKVEALVSCVVSLYIQMIVISLHLILGSTLVGLVDFLRLNLSPRGGLEAIVLDTRSIEYVCLFGVARE